MDEDEGPIVDCVLTLQGFDNVVVSAWMQRRLPLVMDDLADQEWLRCRLGTRRWHRHE